MSRSVTAIALSCALALAACGGGGDDAPDPKTQVRDTLQAYVASIKAKDAGRLCGLIDPEALEGLAGQGLPCEVAMREQFLQSVDAPQLTVGEVSVDGDRATAEVRASAAGQAPSADTLPLRRVDGDWKISFSDEPAAAEPPPAAAPRETPEPDPSPSGPASAD